MGKAKYQYLIDKDRLAATGHSVADLIRASERTVNYRRICGYLTGYWDLNDREKKIFYPMLKQLEQEHQTVEALSHT